MSHQTIFLGESSQMKNLSLQWTPSNSKIKKSKPLSDRMNGLNSSQSSTPKTERIKLIEKKKNYSEAIRQKNMNQIKTKKTSNVVIDLRDCQKDSYEKQNYLNCKKGQMSVRGRIQNSLKKKNMFYGKRQNSLHLEPIETKEEFHNQTIQDLLPINSDLEMSSVVYADRPNRLFICSKTVNEKIKDADQEWKRQMLQKQNSTFKRQLASFRKQNSSLKKQLQTSKRNMEEAQNKVKEALQMSQICQSRAFDENKGEILDHMQSEINELKAINSNLQLKVYVAEKRIVEEVDLVRKKMAKQLSLWKQKWAKLKAENLKIKSYRDMTFSMEISQDE